ncbi:MAG: M23 family metallopeptidase [Bacteroidetes bacterium]|nr:M23 family metallopeptidase [Bacteroidota bacterium]MCL1968922.1 M23 family metallopeptidase [Bacteroidota bacterium]
MNFQKLKLFWKKLRQYWTLPFRLIIRNETNLHDSFSFKLSPRRIFVIGTLFSILIITLTAILIAFTPLRVYVPGYTNPIEYKLYRQMLTRIDSIEKINAIHKVYLDNFYNLLNDIVVFEEMDAPNEGTKEKRIKDKEKSEQSLKQVNDAADQLLIEITDRTAKTYIPLSQHTTYPTFAFTMPALGKISKQFSIQDKHYGIDIENEKGTLITAIADGVIIGVDDSEKEGNILIIQHGGNMVSLYKNLGLLLKNRGDKVKSGDPIATMGDQSKESQRPFLHFEIWYNGMPLNPVEYFVQ